MTEPRLERIMSKRVEKQLRNYPGEWVVWTYWRILAHAPTIDDGLKKAWARKGAVLHYIAPPGGPYFFALTVT